MRVVTGRAIATSDRSVKYLVFLAEIVMTLKTKHGLRFNKLPHGVLVVADSALFS